jgi:hypothetical protein
MAIADWFAAQDAIEAQLRSAPTLSKVDIFTGDMPDGYQYTRPYLVVSFLGEAGLQRHQGITGAQDDSVKGQFTTSSVAESDRDARRLSQIVRGVLVGFVPNQQCGQVEPAFFAGVGTISELSTPTRYSADQAYQITVNADL